jgi:predicted HicB family RNase H-like nuclease
VDSGADGDSQLRVSIDEYIHRRLTEIAAAQGLTLEALAEALVRDEVERLEAGD